MTVTVTRVACLCLTACLLSASCLPFIGDNEATYRYALPPALDDGIAVGHAAHAGMDAAALAALVGQLRQPDGPFKEIHSVLVYRNGMLVLEEYFTGNDDLIRFRDGVIRESRPPVPWHRERKHYVASVNKALTATLAGIALTHHDISLDQPVMSFLPDQRERFDHPHKQALTLRDLLTMRLGFEWDEWAGEDLALMWQSRDFADFLLSRANTGPGNEWVYNSAGPNLLLRALENLVGEPIAEWADRHFYQPLGITDYDWQSQPGGYPEGSARMYMRPRDMLKVGVTYLGGGRWRGRQVIPASWVESVFQTQASSANGDYSYYFWLRQLDDIRYLSADGDGGQYINIFPRQNLVIVITQGNYLEWPLYAEQAERLMRQVLSAVSVFPQDAPLSNQTR